MLTTVASIVPNPTHEVWALSLSHSDMRFLLFFSVESAIMLYVASLFSLLILESCPLVFVLFCPTWLGKSANVTEGWHSDYSCLSWDGCCHMLHLYVMFTPCMCVNRCLQIPLSCCEEFNEGMGWERVFHWVNLVLPH